MNHLSTAILSAVAALLMLAATSCGRGKDYTPMQASAQSCTIAVRCLAHDGSDLLDNKKIADGITLEGRSSNTRLKYELRTINGHKCIMFEADIPDCNDMRWAYDRREASGISKVTLKIDKQRLDLECALKYSANRPPAAAGGTLTLEQVTLKGHTFKKSGGIVPVTLYFDENIRLLNPAAQH